MIPLYYAFKGTAQRRRAIRPRDRSWELPSPLGRIVKTWPAQGYRTPAEYAARCSHTHYPVDCEIN